MFGVVPALDPMHIEVAGFEIHLLPPQRHEFGRAEAVAKHEENNGGIAYPMAARFTRGLHHRLHLVRAKIISPGGVTFLFPGRTRTRRRLQLCRKRTLAGWRRHQLTCKLAHYSALISGRSMTPAGASG